MAHQNDLDPPLSKVLQLVVKPCHLHISGTFGIRTTMDSQVGIEEVPGKKLGTAIFITKGAFIQSVQTDNT